MPRAAERTDSAAAAGFDEAILHDGSNSTGIGTELQPTAAATFEMADVEIVLDGFGVSRREIVVLLHADWTARVE